MIDGLVDAEDLYAAPDVRISPQQAATLHADLLVLCRVAVGSSESEELVPTSVLALLEALGVSARHVSDVGSAALPSRIVALAGQGVWMTADEAGGRVGIGGRRIRQLASSDPSPFLTFRAGRRAPLLVEVDSLRAFLASR